MMQMMKKKVRYPLILVVTMSWKYVCQTIRRRIDSNL